MSRDKIWHLFARKLTGEASGEELQELELLVKEESSLFYEFQAITELWEQEPQNDADYLEATYLLHLGKMRKLGIEPGNSEITERENRHSLFAGLKQNRNRIFAAAVFAGLIILVVSVFFRDNKRAEPIAKAGIKTGEIATKNGSNTQLKLPDGSIVWLNAGSKLNYEKINETGVREVYLTGEAFFDVVKNPKRPFIIHTSSIDIKVLGTKFNVKAYPDDKTVETSLIRGSVEVTVKNRPEEKYLLKPNQKLILMNEAYAEKIAAEHQSLPLKLPVITIRQLSYIKGDTAAVETSWVRNKLIFEDEPFVELAKRMGRWYDVEFEFRNKNIEEERINVAFDGETLVQALNYLKLIARFNYKIEDKKVVIY
jgi:ferric-dicitrate binding protein FerR (iron transport regulator)